ncbi:MAG: phosphatase PAP2 family protein [Anaerolineae bacterium]|nr:phosphatase PAP2 family protein [Anaerolineae bacterium]
MQTTQATAVSPVQPQKRVQDRSGLRSPGLLGRWPIIGVILFLLGGGLFGGLAIAVQSHNPQLLQIDTQIANDLHTIALHSLPIIVGLAIFGYYAGQEIIVGIGVVLVLYFIYKRYWTEMWMVLIAWGGEAAIWLLVSNYFNRPRPVFPQVIWHQMTAPGFPSGHVFGTVLCYGFLAYVIVPKMSTRFWKGIVIAVALLIILYIGWARLFIGDHYPSDVLAGYGLGTAWGAFVYTTVEWISRRRKQHKAMISQA